jgi:hypothetical protein
METDPVFGPYDVENCRQHWLGSRPARFASTTYRCAASDVLAAWTSKLCRLPSVSFTTRVH